MAGFKRPSRVYKLVFTGELEGLEVKARSMSMGDMLDMAPLLDLRVSDQPTPEELEQLLDLLERFAGVLVSWNLEDDDDQPIPADVDGLLTLDPPFVMEIVTAWADAVGGVSDPLPQPSPGGEPSLAASIPMETSSRSLAS